jgi:hypothetical protein
LPCRKWCGGWLRNFFEARQESLQKTKVDGPNGEAFFSDWRKSKREHYQLSIAINGSDEIVIFIKLINNS